MAGTRKMEKFELDAYTKARANELAKKDGDASPRDPNEDLPARTFEPRASGAAHADLPAVPFEKRPESGGPGPADLPALPFEKRPSAASVADARASGSGDAVERPETPSGPWVPGEWIPPQQPDGEGEGDAAAGAGEQDPEALRTRLARKFVTLADSFTDAFRDFAIGAAAYAVELTAPGMSTGGGKQALQHIRLRPRREGYPVLVAGTVNQVERRAELRDFDHIAVVNEVRFR